MKGREKYRAGEARKREETAKEPDPGRQGRCGAAGPASCSAPRRGLCLLQVPVSVPSPVVLSFHVVPMTLKTCISCSHKPRFEFQKACGPRTVCGTGPVPAGAGSVMQGSVPGVAAAALSPSSGGPGTTGWGCPGGLGLICLRPERHVWRPGGHVRDALAVAPFASERQVWPFTVTQKCPLPFLATCS